MKLKYYDLDERLLLKVAKPGDVIGLRMPDGLIPYSHQVMVFLQSHGISPVLLIDPCYGACDVSLSYTNIDHLIYIGEAAMPSLLSLHDIHISYVPVTFDFETKNLAKSITHLPHKRIGLASITPYIHNIDKWKGFLEEHNFQVVIGPKSRRMAYDGQILGCDFTSATCIADDVDQFLFIGDGFFHPIGLYLSTKKPITVYNPLEDRVYAEEIIEQAEKVLRQRYLSIASAMDAQTFGIIVSTKLGQYRPELADRLARLIHENGLKASLLYVDNVTDTIDYLGFDCFVSTACPRIAIDDKTKFRTPMLTAIELEIVLQTRSSDHYLLDQIL